MDPRKILFLLLFLFAGSTAVVPAQNRAAGTVYLDKNGNGKLDRQEKGIPEVAVSNGRDVVLTDENGSYEIDIGGDDIIFVIKPADYALPRDENNLPRFYYIHKPGGSPELDYAGVNPTGSLPDAVDFPLLKEERKERFRVLLFGDPQPYNEREVDYFDRDIVSELQDAEGYAFGVTLGDIVGDDLDLYKPYRESIAKIGIPWFHVIGNHDMNFDAGKDRHADETFEATFGPATYAFNHGKTHFIIMDDVIYPNERTGSRYIGGLREDQLTFIENSLEHVPSDHLVVLAMHIPLFDEIWTGRDTFWDEDRERLFDLLSRFPRTLSVSAHTHIQMFHFFRLEEGWKRLRPHLHYNAGTTSGDWWSGEPDERDIPPTVMRDGTPNGYAILNVEGNDFTIDYKVAGKPEEYRLSKWGPEVVPRNSGHGAQLYVNYFLGNEFAEVEYRVKGGGGKWRPMRRTAEQDPHVASLREKWDRSDQLLPGSRPNNPVNSTHIWKTGVPGNLPAGRQTIEIRITDMFGRTFFDEFSYEVVRPQ